MAKDHENKIDQGGYAFALRATLHLDGQPGMTMRQYYAGQALAMKDLTGIKEDIGLVDIADRCVRMADALIARLKKAQS